MPPLLVRYASLIPFRKHLAKCRIVSRGSALGPDPERTILSDQVLTRFWCRIAVEGRLWGPALLLARFCGEAAYQDTARAMADASLQHGTPLHTLCTSICGPAPSDVQPGGFCGN